MKRFIDVKPLAFFSALLIATLLALFPLSQHPAVFSYSAGLVLVTLMFWSTGFSRPLWRG